MTLEDLARKAAEEIYKSDDFLRDIPLRHRPNIEAAILSALQHAVAERDSEVAALRADKERLDWLDKNGVDIQVHEGETETGVPFGYELHWWKNGAANHTIHPNESLRSAIDSARATQPIGGKPFPPNYGGG